MTKESIIERLLEQGHIVIQCADRILNKKGDYLQDIQDLHRDGPISTKEAVLLLRDCVGFHENNQWQQPHTTYPWSPNEPGTPPNIWYSTTTEL